MKPAIRVLLSLVPLLLLCFADRASANSEQCRQIREVRRLAMGERLEDENLATLENRYCATAQPSTAVAAPLSTAPPDCVDLTVMTRLAQIAEARSDLVRLVESQQQLACGVAEQWGRSVLNYPNGQTAKFRSNWNYPNGQAARFGSVWTYPNGQTAKVALRWNYPNGQTAKSGSTWYYPNGKPAGFENLVSWACSILGRDECATRLLALRNTDDVWSELATLELAWQAYTINSSRE
ncbi:MULTISPECIES: hypothetical protein [unclassified Coleofasciculus]|uniref:hypothetical protein n=1 Tax=unclassified Coleofasciculus TaxID=2692782 RepID=UPI00188251CC|nr:MULTISPECIES: hypothetical protein [unclassified Coleofasciculus]MBE9125163.1 hypothetical protein [Coleofasciculus sp. LEGE 07081]MBE9148380.1 hypothetical protein [Coleofasciculus sp. LEGE 07092]